MTRRLTRRRVLSFAGAGVLASGFAAPAVRAASKLEPATITLDWRVTGYHTPFFLGLEQKIFAANGIDLTVNPGNGSRNTIIAAAANNTTFGMADATALPVGVAQGADVKMVCLYMGTTPFGIMFKKASGIAKPKDLEGKAYGDFPGSATYALFPAFAKKAGVDASKVKIVNISPASQFSALLDNQVDATFTALDDSYVTLTHRGAVLGNFSYADEGLNLLSQGIIAGPDTLKNKDLVKRFARAFNQSVAAMKANPQKAAEVTKRLVPAAPDVDVEVDMMKDLIAHRLTNPRTKGKPAGWMAKADWSDLVDLLAEYGTLKEKVAPDRLYTNEFIT
jgi:NitT/TauT family transport system substrate-binding protein